MTGHIAEQLKRYAKMDVDALAARLAAEITAPASGVAVEQFATIFARCGGAIGRALELGLLKEIPIRGQEQLATQFKAILDKIDAGENAQSWHESILDLEQALWSF